MEPCVPLGRLSRFLTSWLAAMVDRARATSYGPVAALYDTHRPAYADALLDDLTALRPAEVLDRTSQ